MQTENTYVETDLGNIALNPRGEYSDETSYEYLDTVSYMGGSYMCLAELTKTISGIAPEEGKNTEHWQMLTLPGGLTSDYIAMHGDVVNDAKQVETSRAAVELSQQEVEAAQADVRQMRQDTQEAAEEAASSRDSAAGYAQSAETSRTAAKESENNINAQVTGFDTHVTEKTSEAESTVEEAAKQQNVILTEAAAQELIKLQAVAKQFAEDHEQIETNKEDISNKITKFYASNQGETHLADSDNGKIMDMMLYGKSEQKQYSGKNLLELSDNQVQSENLKIQINQGIITFSGTVNTEALIREIDSFIVPSNGTYTISTNSNSNKDSPRILFLINDNPQYGSAFNGATKELNAGDVVRLYVRISSVGSYDGVTIKPMIEKGSKVTSYEPYTGGQPSPSPDYPQEIKSVVNPIVKVTNEDGSKVQSVTLNGITLNAIPVSSGGNITINGQQYIADYVDVERGKIIKCVEKYRISSGLKWIYEPSENDRFGAYGLNININPNFGGNTLLTHYQNKPNGVGGFIAPGNIRLHNFQAFTDVTNFKEWLDKNESYAYFVKNTLEEIDLTIEEIQIFKALSAYYPATNISVNSEQLEGYTVFNYPISMANGWNYVKQQLNDNRDYIYDMDLQSAEAYVNSEYAVALTELEV